MKLKKIASLMLAGIMAVSMLAGCKSGDSNKNDAGSSSSEVVNVDGAAAAINNELTKNKGKISFENDSDMDKQFAAYFALNPIHADNWEDKDNEEYAAVANLNTATVNATGTGYTTLATLMSAANKNAKETNLTVYAFNTKVFSQAAALKYVGQKIDDLVLAEDNSTAGNDGKMYDYSGKASVLEVKSEKGTESVWMVCVVITKDYVAK